VSTDIEPAVNTPPPQEVKTGRVATIVRWAVRITSLPVFGLLMVSLVPALASFGISARDDKIIALGMCGAALGFVLGWRWAGIGGLLACLGVGAMLSQADGSIFADPFAIAFGLQAILFLISWALNLERGKTAKPKLTPLKTVAAYVLAISAVAGAVVIYSGPGPTPIPKEKQIYVGTWESSTGFKLEITVQGRARVNQDKDAKVEPFNTPLSGAAQGEYLINFRTDDQLELTRGPLQDSKVYHIDRRPIPGQKETRMVLNGSDPYQLKSGMLLVKKQVEQAKTSPIAEKH
jgi:hypothetical protein